MPRATLEQLNDWSRRVADVCCEMEEIYGDPGQNYPPACNMAVYLAHYQIRLAIDDIRNGTPIPEIPAPPEPPRDCPNGGEHEWDLAAHGPGGTAFDCVKCGLVFP